MKLLITGGAGFIGSAVTRYILENTQDRVLNLDKLTYAGNLNNLAAVAHSKRYHFEQADICNRAEVAKIFHQYRPDAVMHLAAESHVDRSIHGSSPFIETNILGTHTLLEVARSYWMELDEKSKKAFRFHHISTDEVYGDLPHPDEDPHASQKYFTETSPYAPSSPYSASKASADHLVRAWHRTYGLPTLITNCSNNYGPYQYPEKLIPQTLIRAIHGKSLPVYGKGNQIRDWLYVEDHARALYQAITLGQVGETYNLGGQNEKQNLQLVQSLCELLQSKLPPSANTKITASSKITHYEQLIDLVEDRPGHDQRYAVDSKKAMQELSWRPLETFESGLEKTLDWYLNNESWWQEVATQAHFK